MLLARGQAPPLRHASEQAPHPGKAARQLRHVAMNFSTDASMAYECSGLSALGPYFKEQRAELPKQTFQPTPCGLSTRSLSEQLSGQLSWAGGEDDPATAWVRALAASAYRGTAAQRAHGSLGGGDPRGGPNTVPVFVMLPLDTVSAPAETGCADGAVVAGRAHRCLAP